MSELDNSITTIVERSHGIGFLEGYNKFKSNLEVMVEEFNLKTFSKEQVLEMIMYHDIQRHEAFKNRTRFRLL